MQRSGEHIRRGRFRKAVAASFAKDLQIPCQSGGVTGYIDYALRSDLKDCIQKAALASCSWRIQNDYVRLYALQFGVNNVLRPSAHEGSVNYSVDDSVAVGVQDGVLYALDSYYAGTMPRHGQSDAPGAAVKVQDPLAAGKSGILLSSGIQHGAALWIHLIKTERADLCFNRTECGIYLIVQYAAVGSCASVGVFRNLHYVTLSV